MFLMHYSKVKKLSLAFYKRASMVAPGSFQTRNGSKLLEEEKINLTIVDQKDLHKDFETLVSYRYLFWACMRGHIIIIDYILK